ncbi:MAG: hypothetical protein QOF78_2100 [Phycisphaerales bacterium]|jgi:hypothetical protein|nr:hypothetical protein [Phycisphaerales bacterium]
MSDPVINYAQGGDAGKPAPSRLGSVAFGCAAAAASGVVLTTYLIRHPIPGPAGGLVRALAPALAVLILLLWAGGIACAIVAGRRRGFRGMPAAALVTGGAGIAVLGLMILLQY